MCCDVFDDTGLIFEKKCTAALGNTFIFMDIHNYLRLMFNLLNVAEIPVIMLYTHGYIKFHQE